MWFLASAVLLVASLAVQADPQRGYNYLPPQNDVPCDDVTSTINTIQYRSQVIPTTVNQVSTQFSITVVTNERVVPTTEFRTDIQTSVQVETSLVQRETQVNREQVVTETSRGQDIVQTRYETSTRIVPQVSYVTMEQVTTQVVPTEVTTTRIETRFQDQVEYQTVPVQSTTVVTVPGMNVVSTVFNTQTETSVVQNREDDQTRYETTTLIENQIQTQTIPSPPVIRTSIVQSQNVIPTTIVSTNFQNKFETSLSYVTSTQFQTQTQTRTQTDRKEVVVTSEVRREVVQTEYITQVVPMTQIQTSIKTRTNNGPDVTSTREETVTSVVRQPGQDRVITSEVVTTQQRQEVTTVNENVQNQITVTQTVSESCSTTRGYNYPEPKNPLLI